MFNLDSHEKRMKDALEHFKVEMNKVRTGRAHPSMLDSLRVEVYGAKMPLNQVANVTAPEASMILITPYDANSIQAISSAVRADQTLGLNPSDDGRVVRVPIPPMTEERRKQVARQASEKVEESKIAIRNIRQDAIKDAKKLKDDKEIGEDELKRLEKEVESLIKDYTAQIDDIFKAKEAEILKV
ncbi:MAG: ribosome recycling factor [Candidatus Nomurabacteria bacterium]|jgi:ribosome recycling factor|nr:ribosome recycling factor [Candidatus Nomurabacteria bacterium]